MSHHVGLTKRRLADIRSVGVMQATPVLPPALLLNDGPLNCRPYLVVKTTGRMTDTGDWPSLIWVFTYRKKFVFLFLLLHYFQTPGQEGGDRRPGHSHRDRDAGTNLTKLPRQTWIPRDREWAEIHTPGHGYHNRVASYCRTIWRISSRL